MSLPCGSSRLCMTHSHTPFGGSLLERAGAAVTSTVSTPVNRTRPPVPLAQCGPAVDREPGGGLGSDRRWVRHPIAPAVGDGPSGPRPDPCTSLRSVISNTAFSNSPLRTRCEATARPSPATGLASRIDRCAAPSRFVLAHPGHDGLALGKHSAVASEKVQRYLCRRHVSVNARADLALEHDGGHKARPPPRSHRVSQVAAGRRGPDDRDHRRRPP